MRVFAQMVVRNEADRFLECSLRWHEPLFDAIHIYDDRSTDSTVELALKLGATVTARPEGVPSFLEHEGQFRQAAWRTFEEAMSPEVGDWVLAIDADEFLLSGGGENSALWQAIEEAKGHGWVARRIRIPEVFSVTENDYGDLVEPMVRMDGFWGSIIGTRLFAYRPGGVFSSKAMGSGSEPSYVGEGGPWGPPAEDLFLVHYGYATEDQQKAKHARYSTLMAHGHADAHVQSIVEPPTLVRWEGPSIDVYRGRQSS